MEKENELKADILRNKMKLFDDLANLTVTPVQMEIAESRILDEIKKISQEVSQRIDQVETCSHINHSDQVVIDTNPEIIPDLFNEDK